MPETKAAAGAWIAGPVSRFAHVESNRAPYPVMTNVKSLGWTRPFHKIWS